MTQLGRRHSVRHVGSLRGTGALSIGAEPLGPITYEIDVYQDKSVQWASGRLEGAGAVLLRAFEAGAASLALPDGRNLTVVLSDPEGESAAEITVTGGISV